MKRLPPGFTLLELIITLFIMSILGLMMSAGLNTTISTQQRLEKQFKLLTDVQLAVITLERDLQQFKIPDKKPEDTVKPEPITISEGGLDFTRESLFDAKSKTKKVLTVSYQAQGNVLTRTVQVVKDGKPSGDSDTQILLENMEGFHAQLVPKNNVLQKQATANPQDKTAPSDNVGVQVEFMVPGLGYVKRIIPIAVNNFVEAEPPPEGTVPAQPGQAAPGAQTPEAINTEPPPQVNTNEPPGS